MAALCNVIYNVIHKRAAHPSEPRTSYAFSHTQLVESIQTTTIPPNMPSQSKTYIEQEGRIFLAISALQKKEIRSVR
ncbi:hypothetical protein L9G16_19260, partial [Shewanella sp. A25]|nr:hypothetical protein [Shewanella shenzhenensis]